MILLLGLMACLVGKETHEDALDAQRFDDVQLDGDFRMCGSSGVVLTGSATLPGDELELMLNLDAWSQSSTVMVGEDGSWRWEVGSVEDFGVSGRHTAVLNIVGFGAESEYVFEVELVPGALWYVDDDTDGFGTGEPVEACEAPEGHVDSSTDCDDQDGSSYPGAAEVCDSADNNCDGTVDEDDPNLVADVRFRDGDGDGFGVDGTEVYDCTLPAGWAPVGGDCNDESELVHPAADEVCDGIDNDCDQALDSDDASLVGAPTLYADSDDDGFGDPNISAVRCLDDGWVDGSVATDCDDSRAHVYPGAPEVCDNRDNDCNLDVDDSPIEGDPYFVDVDGDGFGAGEPVQMCESMVGFAMMDGDCDDQASAVNPLANEICNGVDDDCDDGIDDTLDVAEIYANGAAFPSLDAALASYDAQPLEVRVCGTVDAISDEAYLLQTAGPLRLVGHGTIRGALSFLGGALEIEDLTLVGLDGSSAAGPQPALDLVSTQLTARRTTMSNDVDAALEGNGGCIRVNGASITLEGARFEQCAAEFGGAIYVASSGVGVLHADTDTVFMGNRAQRGGAIYFNGDGELDGGLYQSNTASLQGGAVYLSQETDITVRNATFDGNHLVDGGTVGGAMYVHSSTEPLTIEDATFEGNAAPQAGALLISREATLTGVDFIGNSADGVGGVVQTSLTPSVVFDDCEFIGNTGTRGALRAIGNAVDASTVVVRNSLFEGNTMNDSGAIRFQGISGSVTDTVFRNNTATAGAGGALFLSHTGQVPCGTVDLQGVLFEANRSLTSYGGAITARSSAGGCTIHASGVTFDGNRAQTAGTVVHLEGVDPDNPTTAVFESVAFTDNMTTSMVADAHVSLEHASFTCTDCELDPTGDFGLVDGTTYPVSTTPFDMSCTTDALDAGCTP